MIALFIYSFKKSSKKSSQLDIAYASLVQNFSWWKLNHKYVWLLVAHRFQWYKSLESLTNDSKVMIHNGSLSVMSCDFEVMRYVYFSRSLWQQNCVWDTGHWLAVAPNLPQRNAEENSSEHTGRILPERVCCPSLSLLRPLHLLEAWAKGHMTCFPQKTSSLVSPLLWQVVFRLTGHNSAIIHI